MTPLMAPSATRTLKLSRSLWMRWRSSGQRSAKSPSRCRYASSKASHPTAALASRACQPWMRSQAGRWRCRAWRRASWRVAHSRPRPDAVPGRFRRIGFPHGVEGGEKGWQRGAHPGLVQFVEETAADTLRDRVVALVCLAELHDGGDGQRRGGEARRQAVLVKVLGERAEANDVCAPLAGKGVCARPLRPASRPARRSRRIRSGGAGTSRPARCLSRRLDPLTQFGTTLATMPRGGCRMDRRPA